MEKFYFYHLIKGSISSKAEIQHIAVWETCLRKIIFSDELENPQDNRDLDFYENEAALIFLFEVLCGLQSKVIGETEIFGQFKLFLRSESARNISFFQNQQFVQFVLKQVKEIREKYMTGLAVNSYGSLIRKLCQNEAKVSVVGFGHLAQKILPWLEQHETHIHVRNKAKYKGNFVDKLYQLKDSPFFSTLVIAAPLETSEVVDLLLAQNQVTKIIDCRSIEAADVSLKSVSYLQKIEIIELNDLFASIEATQERIKALLPVIKAEIHERVQAYLLKVQHRPLGWDDLCG